MEAKWGSRGEGGKLFCLFDTSVAFLRLSGPRPSKEAVLLLDVGGAALLHCGHLVRLLSLCLLPRLCENLGALHCSSTLSVSNLKIDSKLLRVVCEDDHCVNSLLISSPQLYHLRHGVLQSPAWSAARAVTKSLGSGRLFTLLPLRPRQP